MNKYVLTKINTHSNVVIPRKNIKTVINQDLPEKAALQFMYSAFAKKANNITAIIEMQNSQGKTMKYKVQRKLKTSKNKKPVYVHYILYT